MEANRTHVLLASSSFGFFMLIVFCVFFVFKEGAEKSGSAMARAVGAGR
jgi:hypothetical protein